MAADALKTASKKLIKKTAETIGDLIGNKTGEAVTKSYVVTKSYDDDKITSTASLNNPDTASQTDEKLIQVPKRRCKSIEKDSKLLMS